jgi:AcrR family transcriptional regulator
MSNVANVKRGATGSRRRGRPRSEKARRAILKAAQALLADGGLGAVTMEAVAATAGVGKPTVYRWWPDRHAVAMAALMETELGNPVRSGGRSAIAALRAQLRAIAKRFATTTGRHVASMIAAAQTESELSKAFRNHFVLARRAEGKSLLERAMQNREVRGDLDVEVALDLLYGPLFFRLLMGHAPLNEAFVDGVLDQALQGMHADRTARAPR